MSFLEVKSFAPPNQDSSDESKLIQTKLDKFKVSYSHVEISSDYWFLKPDEPILHLFTSDKKTDTPNKIISYADFNPQLTDEFVCFIVDQVALLLHKKKRISLISNKYISAHELEGKPAPVVVSSISIKESDKSTSDLSTSSTEEKNDLFRGIKRLRL